MDFLTSRTNFLSPYIQSWASPVLEWKFVWTSPGLLQDCSRTASTSTSAIPVRLVFPLIWWATVNLSPIYVQSIDVSDELAAVVRKYLSVFWPPSDLCRHVYHSCTWCLDAVSGRGVWTASHLGVMRADNCFRDKHLLTCLEDSSQHLTIAFTAVSINSIPPNSSWLHFWALKWTQSSPGVKKSGWATILLWLFAIITFRNCSRNCRFAQQVQSQ